MTSARPLQAGRQANCHQWAHASLLIGSAAQPAAPRAGFMSTPRRSPHSYFAEFVFYEIETRGVPNRSSLPAARAGTLYDEPSHDQRHTQVGSSIPRWHLRLPGASRPTPPAV